ncbi:ACP S-malonyltransferase [Singulisphaera sp. PoT]|uniref:ACP S-malonyltransferase n=1 Tax=Singulisphaera sp. PoT TaxID=3411797 RepID=UPI003BF5BD12
MKHIDGRWLRWATIDADQPRATKGSSGKARPNESDEMQASKITSEALARRIGTAALACRGYDVSNLGRSLELLEHPAYGPVVRRKLAKVSEVSSDALGRKVDIAEHIVASEPTSFAKFPLDVATIVGMELAQLELLEQFHGIPVHNAKMCFGYSIGEMSALIFGGAFSLEGLLPVPLRLAPDCAELAEDTSLGVLFTRGGELSAEEVERLCRAVSAEGHGLVGPSAYLSPNTALLLGRGKTLERVEKRMSEFISEKVILKRNPNRWPPLHSPLIWERSIPNRAAVMLYQMNELPKAPKPPVLSCVTGEQSYAGPEAEGREVLIRWTDRPQKLWDVIDKTLSSGVELVIHVGPAPNLIPATFSRLENNVTRQLQQRGKYVHMIGRGFASGWNSHAWLNRLLPSKAALLRLPFLVHITLEDWLLDHQPSTAPDAVSIPRGAGQQGLASPHEAV